MNNKFRLITTVFVSALSINSAIALPIDWSGVFGADTHMLSNTCRTSDKIPGTPTKPLDGSQGLVSDDCNASFSTYIFRLNPTIIVNDGVTFKGELSTGGIRGNFMGGDAANSVEGPNNSYFFTAPAQNSSLNINQAYMELYADTALVRIGRMSKNFGMGLTINDGSKAWDRFYSIYDGIDAEMKIGNFSIIPHYAMISNTGDDTPTPTTTPQEASGKLDVKEIGMTAKYENKNRDLVASLFYAQRSSSGGSTFYQATDSTTPTTPDLIPRGKTDVTIIAPYVSKKWDRLTVAAEGSYQTGKFGHVYTATESEKLSSTAFAFDVRYELNPKWEVGVLAGSASGNDASSSKFGAAYLNPNFQIADLMFRYNYAAINEAGRSIFDSSVTNANFVRLFGNYKTDKWTWKGAFIMATANETAKAGKASYHHEENYKFDGQSKQDSSYGYEFDFGFDYRWNPNVTIGAYYAYWMVGDYYAFKNDPAGEKLDLKSVHGGGLRATLEF